MENLERAIQSIDPTVLGIVVGLVVLAFIIMMCIYIPRIEKLRELENDKKRYKAERDYAVEQWSIAMISGNRQKDKILQDLKNSENRKNQFSKISKTMAEAYDKLKGQYRIDISKQELPVVTFTKKLMSPRQEVMKFSNECISKRIHDDAVVAIGEYVLDNSLAKMYYSVDRPNDAYIFETTVKVINLGDREANNEK